MQLCRVENSVAVKYPSSTQICVSLILFAGHSLMAGPAPSSHMMQQQSHMKNCTPIIGSNSVGRHPPPAYNLAAQRALLHRLGRAHSHEGVTLSYCPPNALISMSGADISNELDVDDNGTTQITLLFNI